MGRALSLVTLRALCVLALAALIATGFWRLAATPFADLSHLVLAGGPLRLTKLPFDEALVGICSIAVVGCGAWMFLVTAVSVTQVVVQVARSESTGARRIPRLATRMCPRLIQRIVLAGCGVALTTSLASPATADQGGPLGGLAMPDRTVGRHLAKPEHTRIKVTAGSSLWSIAEAALPDEAGNAEITAAWHALHRTNSDRVGNDPDLIFPGTTLQIPDLNEHDRKDHQ